jgi:hypothetical protein
MGGSAGGSATTGTSGTSNTTGSTTQNVAIPAWLENAARQNMARADALAQVGYVPYYGPDVAALTPMQVQAMQGTQAASQAFGLGAVDPMSGMPQAQQFAGGVQGYSSQPIFAEILARLQAERPGQFAALNAPFIDPVTGAKPAAPFGSMPVFGETARPVSRPAASPSLAPSAGAVGARGQTLYNNDGSVMTAMDRLNALQGRAYTPGQTYITPGSGTGITMGGGVTSSSGGGGTGSFGLPDPMSGSFAGTNFSGAVGSLLNSITRR